MSAHHRIGSSYRFPVLPSLTEIIDGLRETEFRMRSAHQNRSRTTAEGPSLIRFGIEKKGRRQKSTSASTSMAVTLAAAVGIGAIQCAEIIYSDSRDAELTYNSAAAMWRVHMGCACAGSAAFVLALFFLECVGRGSVTSALRSTISWLPLIALTGIATIIHIPIYVVILLTVLHSVWAYRRTLAVR
jgi:hypothetical protein